MPPVDVKRNLPLRAPASGRVPPRWTLFDQGCSPTSPRGVGVESLSAGSCGSNLGVATWVWQPPRPIFSVGSWPLFGEAPGASPAAVFREGGLGQNAGNFPGPVRFHLAPVLLAAAPGVRHRTMRLAPISSFSALGGEAPSEKKEGPLAWCELRDSGAIWVEGNACAFCQERAGNS